MKKFLVILAVLATAAVFFSSCGRGCKCTYKEDGKKIYFEAIGEGIKDVTALFAQAKTEEGTVEITAGDLTIAFDEDAVNAIGGANVSLSAKAITENTTVENAELVLEIIVTGATLNGGKATVSVPFTKEVPVGKVAKVYYVADNGAKTDMNATFTDGKVSFTTDHFSTYAVMFEDKANIAPAKTGLSSGMIGLIVLAGIVVLALLATTITLLSKKRR